MQALSSRYLTTLTPLRGIAALIIVLSHCNQSLKAFVPPGSTFFIDYAWLWVDFFFILSGFIMCYVYGNYFSKGITRDAYKKFIGARFARVYPLYFITTIWTFVVYLFIVHYASSFDPFFVDWFNLKTLPSCLVLIQSLHIYKGLPLNAPGWSLSTEWWVYMIFPFLVPFFIQLKTNSKLLVTLAIIGFYFLLKYVLAPYDVIASDGGKLSLEFIPDFGLLRCFAGFLLGMLMFAFYKDRAGFAIVKKDWVFITSFMGLLAAFHFGLADIAIIAFFPFIILAAAYNNTLVKRLLDTYLLQRLGDWSFSIYMVHWPIIFMFKILDVKANPALYTRRANFFGDPAYPTGLLLCGIVVTLTLVVASLSYRFLEVPARNYLNKVFKTKRPPVDVTLTNV